MVNFSTSPAAFFVYTTVKVITAAAVTDSLGQVVCGTVSTYPTVFTLSHESGPYTFTQTDVKPEIFTYVNSNAEAYYGGPSISKFVSIPLARVPATTYTATYPQTNNHTTSLSLTVLTAYSYPHSYFYLNSAGSTIQTDAPRPSGVTITLDKPFIYAPAYGAAGATGGQFECQMGNSSEGWGVVPQTLMDHILKVPSLSSRYREFYSHINLLFLSMRAPAPGALQEPLCKRITPVRLYVSAP